MGPIHIVAYVFLLNLPDACESITFPFVNVTDITRCVFPNDRDHCTISCSGGYYSIVGSELEKTVRRDGICPSKEYALRITASIRFRNYTTIPERWLNTSLTINHLEIDMSEIREILTDAFDSKTFKLVRRLILINFRIHYFSPHIFRGMSGLHKLTFIALQTTWFPDDFLLDVAGGINELHVYGPSASGNGSFNVDGITGGHTAMIDARSVKFLLGLGASITRRTFGALTRTLYLDLSNCRIEAIGAGSFDSMRETLLLLKLDNNHLQRLPDRLFDALLWRPTVAISLDHNHWQCVCDLGVLRDYLSLNRSQFSGEPLCTKPEHLAGLTVEHAKFSCNPDDENNVQIRRKIMQCPDRCTEGLNLLQLPKRNLTVMQRPDGREVRLFHQMNEKMVAFVWRNGSQELANGDGTIVCPMDRWRDTVSPYECVSFYRITERPIFWLRLAIKERVVLFVAASMVLMMFVGFGMGWLIRSIIRSRDVGKGSVLNHNSSSDGGFVVVNTEYRYEYQAHYAICDGYEFTTNYAAYLSLVVLSDYCTLDRIPAEMAPQTPAVPRRKSVC